VPLGSAASVDTLVAHWRDQLTAVSRSASSAEAETDYRTAGAALRTRIWDPIRNHLNGATTVFVVPDGSLNLVSLVALPIGQTRYLIEEAPVLHYLSAERDLVTGESSSHNGGLLALGGAAFDDASVFAGVTKPSTTPAAPESRLAPVASTRTTTFDKLSAGCPTLRSMRFSPLAETRREVQDVAKLWTDSPAEVLDGRAASERAFKHDAPGHEVLHLATHGFFLGNDCSVATGSTRSVGGLTSTQNNPAAQPKQRQAMQSVLTENPLLLSGLALAGANRRAAAGPSDDDGILTAEEVTALNLEGVKWVVLSACDTGLGEVKAGEGVFGLRRAFQIAGARTIIMSLWSVDDEATRIWMRALYQNRLEKHLSTADSVHAASLDLLRERRARGQGTHPFYWAGFVAAGDWR
jgi:CHAT domain-containing protein